MKVSNLLSEYFDTAQERGTLIENLVGRNLPISPLKSDWKRKEDSLLRAYNFTQRNHLKDFVSAALELEDETYHSVILRVTGLKVEVKCESRSFGDDEFTKSLDEVYNEITGL